MQIEHEHDYDETFEDLKGNCVFINKVVQVVAGNDKDQMTDSKPDHDIAEVDDDKGIDDYLKNPQIDEDTKEEVRGYNGISVNKNDDDLNNEVNEHNNEAQNFEVDEENSMVDPENLEKVPELCSVPSK